MWTHFFYIIIFLSSFILIVLIYFNCFLWLSLVFASLKWWFYSTFYFYILPILMILFLLGFPLVVFFSSTLDSNLLFSYSLVCLSTFGWLSFCFAVLKEKQRKDFSIMTYPPDDREFVPPEWMQLPNDIQLVRVTILSHLMRISFILTFRIYFLPFVFFLFLFYSFLY